MKRFISIAMTVALAMSLVPATAFAKDDVKTTKATVDVAVIGDDDNVALSVDEGEDVPMFYSGVSVKNTGITDDANHVSLAVTVEERFAGAWDMSKGFTFTLPEGVYAVGDKGVMVINAEGFTQDGTNEASTSAWKTAFKTAYEEGEYKSFAFGKRTFGDADATLVGKTGKVKFAMTLVAEPWFEGDVVLGLEGAAVEPQEVVIATFVKPYTVQTEQVDWEVEYRYVPEFAPIVITEVADGLLAEGVYFEFSAGKENYMMLKNNATYDVGDSEMELEPNEEHDDKLGFKIKTKSDEAATITIFDFGVFVERDIPAGPYHLTMRSSLHIPFRSEVLFGHTEAIDEEMKLSGTMMVQEGYINIIRVTRSQEGNDFTTKVVVPVGEGYLISDEMQIALDVPAYITETGYTMLPVRAVATALGINNNNVLWDNEEKTVTVLYGQRIVTMIAGDTVFDVNGSVLPASAEIEIINGRAFLPMRDLARALSITDITWDAQTKTATLNGSGNE